MSSKTISIIGYGDFSKLMIRHLAPHYNIVVSSRQPKIDKNVLKFEIVDLKTALAQNVIIPSIPAQKLESFFNTNIKLLNPNALIIDVCSVKVKPVQSLKKVLPSTNQILATHPLFGPASAKNGLKGHKIMMYPVRIPKQEYELIKAFCSDTLKLKIIECTPEHHDKVTAYALGLSHYIGRLMRIMDIPNDEISTNSYDDLLDMKNILSHDGWELFESVMLENPYALKVNSDFKKAIKKLDTQLGIN